MKKVLLAMVIVLSTATIAYAHDLVHPYSFAFAPYSVGTDIWGVASAQIDDCIDNAQSGTAINTNCGRNGQKGFKAGVRGAVQVHSSIGKWIAVGLVQKRIVTMGVGTSKQAYDTQFSVTAYGTCPINLHGSLEFRTVSKIGFNWHGTWQWTAWVPSITNSVINCP